MLQNLRGWQHDAWFKGEWDLPLGQYFVNFREDVHVLKEIDDKLAREWFCGLDYGFTHYTCCYLGFQSHDGDWFVVNRHRARQWLPAQHAGAIRKMIGQHRIEAPGYHERKLQLEDIQRIFAGSDAFSRQPDGTTIADQYRKHGIKLTFAYTDRLQGWALIHELLGCSPHAPHLVEGSTRPRLFIHARCAELVESLPLLQHDPHRPEDVLKVDCDEEGNGGDDDAVLSKNSAAGSGQTCRWMGMNVLQFCLLFLAGQIDRNQQLLIDYLLEEVKVLREQLGRKPHFTDRQRLRLAAKAKKAGINTLRSIVPIVTPKILLRWQRRLIARKYDGTSRRSPGRPRTNEVVRTLILRFARENPTWGDTPFKVL